MSTTHKLPFTRFTKQANTGLTSYLSTDAAAIQAAALLQAAPWVESAIQDATFPPRAAVLVPGAGASVPDYDAYKYCGDVAAGKQKAYAGAVAYRYQIPAEALAGTVAEVLTVDVPLYVDRWLVDGVRLAAYVSDDPMPPSAWATIRAGDAKLEAQLPMTYTDPGGDRIVVDKNATLTVTMPVDLDAKSFLYIMVTLEDYATTGGNYAIGASEDRKFWIEGASFILGTFVEVEFNRAVDGDPDGLEPGLPTSYQYATATANMLSTNQYMRADATFKENNCATTELFQPASPSHFSNSAYINQVLAKTQIWVASTNASAIAKVEWSQMTVDNVLYQTWKCSYGLIPLAGGVFSARSITAIRLLNPIPAYPAWMQIKLAIYANQIDSDATLKATTARAVAGSAYQNWMNGEYSSNGYFCLASTQLDPIGYLAGAEFLLPAPVALAAGILGVTVAIGITSIIGEIPLAALGQSAGLELACDGIILVD